MKSPVVALASVFALLIGHLPAPLFAQSIADADEGHRVSFGETQIVLRAPSQHCMLESSQPADQKLATLVFRPRAGKLNTYLGAFVDCKSLTAIRSAGPEHSRMSGYAYYLAVTSTATNPVVLPRNEILQRVCDNARARSGALDVADQSTPSEINAWMDALPAGKPWFGPIVAQDSNGCYQIVLYKSLVSGMESRETMLTIVTFVKRIQVTYTRSVPFASHSLSAIVRMVQSELADFLASNQ